MKHDPSFHSAFGFQAGQKSGQVLVVFAISLLALLFFIGLALDAGIVYVNYGQLKRAVDSGAVAAANNFKAGATNEEMYAAVLEVLKLQNMNVDPAALNLVVTTCDMNGDGWQDNDPRDTGSPPVQPLPADFAPLCPITDPTDATLMAPSARKLVYVGASQRTPLYFLSLLGIGSVNLKTFSIAEAAAVDLVLVIDTSESMGNNSAGYAANKFDFDPSTCNAHWSGSPAVFTPSSCYPLRDAIDAANHLVDQLYAGYDNISLITYDTVGHQPGTNSSFHLTSLVGGNKATVKQVISEIQLHDDAPYWNPPNSRLRPMWYTNFTSGGNKLNPANLEDRDGNGVDADPGAPCWVQADNVTPRVPTTTELDDHWDYTKNVPCDFDGKNDAYDWNGNGTYDDPINPPTTAPYDSDLGASWLANTHNSDFSLVSTCTGCGIRLASNELKTNGRPGAVWVVVLLSDGLVNMSDTFTTLNDPNIIPASYPNGFCTQKFWVGTAFCTDGRPQVKATYPNNPYRLRYCIDKSTTGTDPGTCPPGSIWEPRNPLVSNYSVFDYALDMVDEAALRVNNTSNPLLTANYNSHEPTGNDIAIYSIGMGPAVAQGVPLLRYMAAVGDDGDRVTDECLNSGGTVYPYDHSCGQYYYASGGADLGPIFDSIASRIYTKIAH